MRKWKNPPYSVHHLYVIHYHQKKVLRPRISFRVNTTVIDNQYGIYYRTCVYGSSILEWVDLTVSYVPVAGIRSLRIIIYISSSEGLIILVLYLSNAF